MEFQFKTKKRPTVNAVEKALNVVAHIGTTALICPLSQGNSASRMMMATNQSSQTISPYQADIPIILSGGESAMATHTFGAVMPCEAEVIACIPHYQQRLSDKRVDIDVPRTIIYRETETGVHNFIVVDNFVRNHVKFGHKTTFDPIVKSLTRGSILMKGQRLTRTSNIHEGEIHSNTLNTNTIYISDPATTEDGYRVSESYVKRSLPLAMGDLAASYGTTHYLVNTYGDEKRYRPFPSQGQAIRDDGMVFCLREYDENWDHIYMHKECLRVPDRMCDQFLFGQPGAIVHEVKVASSANEKKKCITHEGMSELSKIYYERSMQLSKRLISVYTEIQNEHKAKIHPALQRMFADSFMVDPNGKELIALLPRHEQNRITEMAKTGTTHSKRLVRVHKNSELDEYRVEIHYSWRYHVGKGAKFSDRHGNKGVICEITPDEDMFRDEYGNVADMAIFSRSVSARMNGDQLWEQYMCGYIRDVGLDCRAMFDNGDWQGAWDHLIKAYSIVAPHELDACMRLKTTDAKKQDYLRATIYDVPRIHCLADNTYVNEDMYMAMRQHRRPNKSPITYRGYHGRMETTFKSALIAPKVVAILEKTAHTSMACSSTRAQHHGLPVSSDRRLNASSLVKNQGPRVLGESEVRAHSAIVGGDIVATIMEISCNPQAGENAAMRQFTLLNPMGMDTVVDRNVVDLGGNRAIVFLEHFLEVMGTKIIGNTVQEKEALKEYLAKL